MVPIIIMESGEVMAPILATDLSINSGTGILSIRRAMPRNTVMMQGLRRIFLHLLLKSETVKRESPAVHIIIRLGIIKMEAYKSPSAP